MDKFTSGGAKQAMEYHTLILDNFKNKDMWHPVMIEGAKSLGEESVNAFHTFFNHPSEMDGNVFVNPLRMSDMKNMYPKLIEKLPLKGSNRYLYIFVCNEALGPGQALVAYNILES